MYLEVQGDHMFRIWCKDISVILEDIPGIKADKYCNDKSRLSVIKIPHQTEDTGHNTTHEKQSFERDICQRNRVLNVQIQRNRALSSYECSTDVFAHI